MSHCCGSIRASGGGGTPTPDTMMLVWNSTTTAGGYMWAWSPVSTPTGGGAATNIAAAILITDDGILDILQAYHAGTLGGSALLITYELQVNLIPSGLSVQLAINSAGPASNVVTQIPVVRGDRIYCFMTNPGPNITTFPTISCRFTRN